jgi:hypothetical protein
MLNAAPARENYFYLSRYLAENQNLLAAKTVTVGFDGFVDAIMRVILAKPNHSESTFFQYIQDFGGYIEQRAGKSFSLETEEIRQKLGGNMPITAYALAAAGLQVNAVGALGLPYIHPVFRALPANCQLYPIANPGLTSALEFADGKIMLAQMQHLHQLNWPKIKNILGLEKLVALYQNSDLISLLNWSELDGSSTIWQGLLRDVFPRLNFSAKPKTVFFDLSDCSKRSDEAIREALQLIKQFGIFCAVVLSLNRNEAQLIYRALLQLNPPDNLNALGDELYRVLDLDTLVIHTAQDTLAWHGPRVYRNQPFFIPQPNLSTGAGDNFNAGFCMGLLLNLEVELCLLLGNTVASRYIQDGESPSLSAIVQHLHKVAEA